MRWPARIWSQFLNKDPFDFDQGDDIVNDTLSLMAVPGQMKLKANISVGVAPANICYASSVQRMYAAAGSASVVVINPATLAVVTTIALTVGDNPVGICYSPTTDRVYVACSAANVVRIINPNTNAVVGSVAVGTAPREMQWCSQNNKAMVCNYGASTVSFIDCATAAVSATTGVGSNPTLCNGSAYLARAQIDKVYSAGVPTATADYVAVNNFTANSVSVLNAGTYAVDFTAAQTYTTGYPNVYSFIGMICPIDARVYLLHHLPSWFQDNLLLGSKYGDLTQWVAEAAVPSGCSFMFYDATRDLMVGRGLMPNNAGAANVTTYLFFTPHPLEHFNSGATGWAGNRAPVMRQQPAGANNGTTDGGACVDPVTGNIFWCVQGNNVEVVGS